jgi:hypothetical protein
VVLDGMGKVARDQRVQVNCWWRPNVSGINECRKLVQKKKKIKTGEELYRGRYACQASEIGAANARARGQGQGKCAPVATTSISHGRSQPTSEL